MENSNTLPIQRACSILGGQTALARELGLTAGAIHQWVRGLRPVPLEHGAAIEKATGGLVTRQDLFPEAWPHIWPELIGATTKEATP